MLCVQMQMVLICLGEGFCMVVMGDFSQCDLYLCDFFGLLYVLFILVRIKGVVMIIFDCNDVVCYDFVVCIVVVYEEDVVKLLCDSL